MEVHQITHPVHFLVDHLEALLEDFQGDLQVVVDHRPGGVGAAR